MNTEIRFDDITLTYVTIEEARTLRGLRLILGAYAIPGPWRESCKGLFDVKVIPYVSARCANRGAVETRFGADGTHSELIQASGPYAALYDLQQSGFSFL